MSLYCMFLLSVRSFCNTPLSLSKDFYWAAVSSNFPPQISLNLTVLEILGTLPSSLEFWFSMEDSHLEKSLACRYMLQTSLAAQRRQHVGVFAEQIEHWDYTWFLPGMTSEVQNCAGQLAQLLPSGRSITDLSSTSESGRGNRLICGYPARPPWTCSFCTCGQSIQRAIQMVTKGSLHHWVLPFHHHAAWPFKRILRYTRLMVSPKEKKEGGWGRQDGRF